MSDPWGAIGSEVWRSRKFRPLPDLARIAYIYVHACPHRTPIGLFRLPIPFIADDLDRGAEECRAAISQLAQVRLIEYDADEALIWIRNWEARNAPDGPLEAIGRMSRNYDKAPDHDLTVAAFLTFTKDIMDRASGLAKGGDGWKTSDARLKMEDMIFHRLTAFWRRDPLRVRRGFEIANVDPGDRVFESLWYRVSDTQSAPFGIPTRTIDTDTDKDMDMDMDHDRDRDRDTDRELNARAGRAIPTDVQRDIEALTAKAKAARS